MVRADLEELKKQYLGCGAGVGNEVVGGVCGWRERVGRVAGLRRHGHRFTLNSTACAA